jgi:WD40 repeat protein
MNFDIKIIVFILSAILIEVNNAQNFTFQAHNNWINGISFTNDNKVITTSIDETMKVWDPLNNWTFISNYFQNIPSCCRFSSNEVNKNGLFAALTDVSAYIWNLTDSNKLIKTFIGGPNDDLVSLAMTSSNILPTGSSNFAEYDQNIIKLWGINSINPLFTLTGHTSTVWSLAFLSDLILVSASADTSIRIWNIANGSCIKTLTGHTGPVTSVLVLSNELIASGSGDNTIKIWNVTNSSCVATLTGHTGWVRSLSKISDSIIASAGNKSIIVWNLSDLTIITEFEIQNFFYKISYSSELDILVAGLLNGFINIWYNFSELISPNNDELITTSTSTATSTQISLITQQQSSTVQFDSAIESNNLISSFKNNFNSFFSNLLS